MIAGLGGWSCITEIESAVIASGTIVAGESRKAVQHDTGAIVKGINFKDDDVVEVGEVIVPMDGNQIASEIVAAEKRIESLENAELYELILPFNANS